MKRQMTAAVVAAMLLVSGCAAPERQYAGALGMYFALPAAWSSLPARELTDAEAAWTDDVGSVFGQTVQWQGAWSAGEATAAAVFAAAAPDRPVVFAFIRDLIPAEEQGLTEATNLALRDVALPATALLDAGTDVQAERVKRGAFEGLHQFATYRAGGRVQTVEVLSMLAPSRKRVYVLLARCSERCFSNNSGTIDAVFDSLTFKETHGQ